MNHEQLLRPRYKVIATWPGMCVEPFHLWQVITLQRHVTEEGQIWIHIPIRHVPDSYMRQEFFDNFPHLFQPLQWWEDRRIDEVPEYVKCIKTPDQQIMPGMVLKVTWVSGWGTSGRHVVVLNTGCFEPATKQEYLEYINQNK